MIMIMIVVVVMVMIMIVVIVICRFGCLLSIDFTSIVERLGMTIVD